MYKPKPRLSNKLESYESNFSDDINKKINNGIVFTVTEEYILFLNDTININEERYYDPKKQCIKP